MEDIIRETLAIILGSNCLHSEIMKILIIYIILLTCFPASAQDDKELQKAILDGSFNELPEGLDKLYTDLFKALLERDIQACPRFFGGIEYHKALYSKSRSEGALEKSFDFAKIDYLSDCSLVMDQFPKVGKTLVVLKYEVDSSNLKLIRDDVFVITGVVARCGYGTGLARLTYIPPDAALVSGKWRFIDRFNQTVRFQYLDPSTGE